MRARGARVVRYLQEEIGLDVANACLTQGLTAHYLTHDAHAQLIKPGEWMLIHGVGSGACQWAAQMAKIKGYKVIGTTSTSKEAVGAATGCDELIVLDEAPGTSYEDYTSKDIVAEVMKITDGVGCKAVIDGIGLATFDISMDSLARRGTTRVSPILSVHETAASSCLQNLNLNSRGWQAFSSRSAMHRVPSQRIRPCATSASRLL